MRLNEFLIDKKLYSGNMKSKYYIYHKDRLIVANGCEGAGVLGEFWDHFTEKIEFSYPKNNNSVCPGELVVFFQFGI